MRMHGNAEAPLAMAIKMRHMASRPLLNKPQNAALDEGYATQLIRDCNHLESVIVSLAQIADLNVCQPALMGMNPIQFANSFRDSDLHFLLAPKLTKIE